MSAATIDTFGIALPDDWFRIPLEGDEFETFANQQRRRIRVELDLSPTGARQFELLIRQLRNDCRREHVTLAAVMALGIEQPSTLDGTDVDPGLLTAACTISSIDRTDMGSELPLTVNTIAAAMSRTPESDDGIEITNLEKPSITELPAGQAVRLVRTQTHPPSAVLGERLTMFAQHYLVPFGEGQRAAVVTFTSASPQYARPLSKLFEQMIRTFRMFGGEMPTDPIAVPVDGRP